MDKDQPAESSEEIDKVEDVSEEKAAETVVEGEVVTNEEDSPEGLTKLLEDARSKAGDHWDQLMRTRAEMDNLRKRQERDLENAHKFALDKFSQDLLQVWDSLELGHQAAQEESADVEKLQEGTELTLRLLKTVMEKNGVEQVDPTGEIFNPEFHQAMSMQERDDVEPNTVVAVVQKGYRLNGRLIRPAMVMVSKAPSAPVDEKA
ncbi:MAG: nucleotide exchange factor GrpE [endosymbiont of Seepiophila jonesi]|uniref:Protein GrpE n=1 Tax=endosymbiont of Lamellibrachia luymesi TaxID=2200907 RepID=A0A370E186_9GAMM|nr:MAG: nucleotide exchange factor GrpE [endosymbiont of Seepiophila jonesi]RDH93323.1 MAG: nucleotide exchange factor GrpE [endosymbiont of Lamellibrachia luymesi]